MTTTTLAPGRTALIDLVRDVDLMLRPDHEPTSWFRERVTAVWPGHPGDRVVVGCEHLAEQGVALVALDQAGGPPLVLCWQCAAADALGGALPCLRCGGAPRAAILHAVGPGIVAWAVLCEDHAIAELGEPA